MKNLKGVLMDLSKILSDDTTTRMITPKIEKPMVGMKESEGKRQWDLLPVEALEEVIKAFEFGLGKYCRGNYEAGIPYTKIFSAAQRHLWAWMKGEAEASDSKVHHLAHAATCCLMLLVLELNADLYKEFDDRHTTPLHQKLKERGSPCQKTPL